MNIFSELGRRVLLEEILKRKDKKGNVSICKVGYTDDPDDWEVAEKRLTLSDGRRLIVRNA